MSRFVYVGGIILPMMALVCSSYSCFWRN